MLAAELTDKGVRVTVDARTHVSAGFKFNKWELRGVPVRVGSARVVSPPAPSSSSTG